MSRLTALFAFAALFLTTGCITMSHTATSRNGHIQQKTCINGECHRLIGQGSIFYDHRRAEVRVQCLGRGVFIYNQDEMQGYDCILNEPIYN